MCASLCVWGEGESEAGYTQGGHHGPRPPVAPLTWWGSGEQMTRSSSVQLDVKRTTSDSHVHTLILRTGLLKTEKEGEINFSDTLFTWCYQKYFHFNV